MNLALCNQMRALDSAAIEEFGIPGIVLMENAAISVFGVCKELTAYSEKSVIVFCGTGNNGGDGFAIARHMHNDGARVLIVLVGSSEKIGGDARYNFEICKKMQIDILEWSADKAGIEDEIKNIMARYPLVVDAVLGTGVEGELRAPIGEAVDCINSGRCIVAVDTPTGGNPDTGQIMGACVKADVTVALALIKPGLLLYPLADFTGKLVQGGIGAPSALLQKPTGLYALDTRKAAGMLPKRYNRSHKGTYGKLAIVAGSASMIGAAAFCARAAYKSGCGYVDVCAPAGVVSSIQQLAPQAVTTPLSEEDGQVCPASANTALNKINRASACLIGPGLGISEKVSEFVKGVIKDAKVPLIIDADALNAVSDDPDILRSAAFPPIVTPHPLEMSRLSGLTVSHILNNMMQTAKAFSSQHSVITLLKDATTVIADKENIYLNKGACSAMAKAGSGDILAGIVGGFMAQGMDGLSASALGAFIHSKSGSVAAVHYGEHSVSSDNIIDGIHEVIKHLLAISPLL